MSIFFGLCASVAVVALSLSIQRHSVVLISSVLAVLTMAQYAFLDRWTTVVLGAVTLVYGLLTTQERRFSWLTSRWSLLTLCGAYTAIFALVNGLHLNAELLVYAASLSGVVVMALSSPLVVKWIMAVNGVAWLSYQLLVGAYGQLPGEVLYAIGVSMSLTLLYRAQRRGVPLAEVPEVATLVRRWWASWKGRTPIGAAAATDPASVAS